MNFREMMKASGIDLENLSDYQFVVLLNAVSQEKERRDCIKRERRIAEYTDKIDRLITEISDEGLVVYYCGTPINIQKIREQLVIGYKDEDE